MSNFPRILIVSRGVWNEDDGTSSTLTNIFSGYDPDMVAHIYTQTLPPNTRCCSHFFQISEIALVKKLFRWGLKTGKEVFNENADKEDLYNINDERKIYSLVRQKRLYLYTILQDALWSLGGWKSEELERFIKDFAPDIVWIDGIVSIFMCKLYLYVINVAQRPTALYMMDDNYTYESLGDKHFVRRWILRKYTRKIVSRSQTMFVISPKMKTEFDAKFNKNSIILTKGIDYSKLSLKKYEIHNPVRLLYLGQVLYGRVQSLRMLASALDDFNSSGVRITLDVYTNTFISEEEKEIMSHRGSVIFHNPVPYSQVPDVMQGSDVLLFMESLDKHYSKDARLSFSTKITDYLSSGKCIFAIGPSDSASIEYFRQEESALVASSESEVRQMLNQMVDSVIIEKYAKFAFECGRRNHEMQMMRDRVLSEFYKLSTKKSSN